MFTHILHRRYSDCTHRKLWYLKLLNVSPEKSQILSCDTVVANERFVKNVL
jgi:hypothetical protein